ncbi:MAG: portal protein [Bacteroidia bacterium]
MAEKNNFRDNVSGFFNKLQKQDLIKIGDGKITSLSQPADKDELKRRSEFSVFRQFLQQKNWSTKHLELFNEYRKMDDSFPIINAALRLYSQEICLTGDVVLTTPMGDKTILELFNAGKSKSMFYVHTVDFQYKRTQWGMAKYIKYNGKKPVYEVVVERNIDDETAAIDKIVVAKFKCTDNHKIMLPDGVTFKMLNELSVGDRIFSFYKYTDPTCSCKVDKFQSSKILSITPAGEEDVYDLVNVEPYSHFSIKLTDSFYVQVHNCTKDDDGNVIKIHSKDKEIKASLEDFFFNKLKLNSQAYLLVKEMIKFGNLYCNLQIRKGDGVIDLLHIPPEGIRIELLSNAEHLDDFKYTWFGQAGGGMQFEPWEIVHFKNIEDIETQPYGTSILRSIVDTWRRIILMREALIIYRITRAPQRYLFKIDTTGMDPDAALLYAEEIKKQLYKKPMVNPFTGEIDFKYNPLPVLHSTRIKLLDGRILTIKEIAEEYEAGKTNYVYSVQDNTHEVVAGKVVWCGKNYTADKLIKVWLDDNSYITTAPEHPFILRNGAKVRADKLKEGQSLMPFYSDEKPVWGSSTYTRVYNPSNGEFEFTHRLIAKEIEKSKDEYKTIHHKDFNRYNNRPDNLQWVDFFEHSKMHSEHTTKLNKFRWANDAIYREKMIQCNIDRESWKPMFESMKDPILRAKQKENAKLGQIEDWKKNKDKRIETMTLYFNEAIWVSLNEKILSKEVITKKQAVKFINENFKKELWEINPEFSKQPNVTVRILNYRLKELGYNGFEGLRLKLLNISKKDSRSEQTSVARKEYFKVTPNASASIIETNKRLGKTKKMSETYIQMCKDGLINFKGDKNPNFKGFANKEKIKQILDNKEFKNFQTLLQFIKDEFKENKQHFYMNELATHLNISLDEFKETYISKTKETIFHNHKVLKIEILENVSEDVYCMTVEGENGENDRHNFSCLSDFDSHTNNFSGVTVCNSIEENFYQPTFEGDVGGIEVLQGACLKGNTIVLTNLGAITIKEMSDNWTSNQKLFVLSSNKYGYITPGKVLCVKETKQTNTLFKITINNSIVEEATDNHPFLLNTLIYKRADELQVGDQLKGMYEKEYIVSDIEVVTYEAPESVYDLEVEEFHNFALASGIFVHNSNLNDVEDYNVIKDDLFAGLLIPKSYLTFEEDLSNKAALAQEDMRFSGAVKQYQGNFIEGLLHIALVHLHTQGFSKEDLENFEIEMNTNSKLLKKLENETLQQQIDLAKSILDISNGELTLMSYTQVLKDVMKFSDEQITQSFENQLLEKKIAWRLMKLKTEGFFEEPVSEKKEDMMKRLGTDDVFSKLHFESISKKSEFSSIFTENVKKEISKLVKPMKLKATKNQINKLVDLNPSQTDIKRVKKDIGLKD